VLVGAVRTVSGEGEGVGERDAGDHSFLRRLETGEGEGGRGGRRGKMGRRAGR